MTRYVLLTMIIFLAAFLPAPAQVTVNNLRCEMLQDPLGIDRRSPRLSWELVSGMRDIHQVAYQLIVSSSKEKAANGHGDLWNSGRVEGPNTSYVIYAGKELRSRSSCYWRVKSYTNKGETSWSEVASWSVGLLSPADWKAKWIGYDKASPWDSVTQWSRLSARYLRKEFRTSRPVKTARLYIVGLGLYRLSLNGNAIGDRVLAPAPTDYRKSVFYNTYDVTEYLRNGENTIGVVLGNGRFFTMRQNYKPKKHNTFGFPKLLLQLEVEYDDGKKQMIVSDESWKLNADGPIRTNNEYDGEEYDATKAFGQWTTAGFNDAGWMKPDIVSAPQGRVVAQVNEPVKVMALIHPKTISELSAGRYILDMGQNFSGWLQVKARGPRGTAIRLRFAESLQPGGQLYVANLRDARVTDIYTMAGNGLEEWEPSFVYHGFRYVEITGYPGKPALEDFTGKLVFDALETTGSFWCSDSIINRIHRNAWWGIASNYKGMPIDCPQRNERQPWLGDRATGAGGEAFLFDNQKLYTKWLRDIEQSQTSEGAIPDVAPAFWNYYTDNVTWPGTFLLVADMLYRQYGDSLVIFEHYASMKKWMQYMQKKYMVNYIMERDKYGDWCVPPESLELIRSRDSLRTTNGELIATAYYYHLLQLMQKFAALSGNQADIGGYIELAQQVKAAFNTKFYRADRRCYDNNTITANLLPLYFNMTPVEYRKPVLDNIIERITVKDNMHISTGVIGTQWLMRALTDYGYEKIAYKLASNRTYPSWGYMSDQGATTIWELWNGNTASPQMNSQNHVMLLGDFLIWLYEDLAGIASADNSIAFHRLIMKPALDNDLTEVKAAYRSVYGRISSEWKKNGTNFQWNIEVPPNTTAIVYLPAATPQAVKESGKPAAESEGVKFLRSEQGKAVFEVVSGKYSFEVTMLKSF